MGLVSRGTRFGALPDRESKSPSLSVRVNRYMSMKPAAKFLALIVFLLACDSPFGVNQIEGPLLQTEALEYRLIETATGYETEIPYSFTNWTGSKVFLINCNGDVSPGLERNHAEEWNWGWVPMKAMCLSSPVVIQRGAEYHDTLRVFAGSFGSNLHPQFESEDVGGVYRLRWEGAFSTYDPDGPPFGKELPLALRVSNSFVLIDP
jgi:hypothetical protein